MRFWNHTWEREHPTHVNKQEEKLIGKTGSETHRQWSWMVGKSQASVWTLKRNSEIGTMNMEPLILLFSFGYKDEIALSPTTTMGQSH